MPDQVASARVGKGTNLVDMIYVENAAAAHLAAADALDLPTRPAGKAYFLSQGEPVNCWEWINDILALADLPPIEKSIDLKTGMACRSGMRTGLAIVPITRRAADDTVLGGPTRDFPLV